MADKKRKDNKNRILKDNEFQRPDGRYMYRYYNPQGEMCYIYSWKLVPTDKVPNGKRDDISLREKIEQITADKFQGIDSKAKGKTTLNQVFDRYIESKRELKQTTRTNYKYMYNNYVRNTIGKRKISDIKYTDIKCFYNDLIDKKNFKPNSVENIHTVLHPVFTIAVRDDIIHKNPTDGVMSEVKKSHNWEKAKRHALTEDEQTAFVEYVRNSSTYNHWLNLLTVFLGTGCRVGELIGLRWEDCDFDNNMISINHNLVYRQQDDGQCEMHITTPKTSAGTRQIPMLKEVRKALWEEKLNQFRYGRNTSVIDGYKDFIFTNRDGRVLSPASINRALERIRLEYNKVETENAEKEHREPLIIEHFSVHNLRHTFCTRFCENETNVKVIQEIMGHSDISTTMNVYAEATENKKKEVFNNLEGKIKIC